MFDDGLDLADVLNNLRRADESLTEFVAPLWPGVERAAVWMEGQTRLYQLDDVPAQEGYYLLGTADDRAHPQHLAEERDAQKYRSYLTAASVILLEDGLAYPASFAEQLQGITAPRPIHFAEGEPLRQVQARYDGINLFYDGGPKAKVTSAIEDLFGASDLFSPGELFGIPGETSAGGDAEAALAELREHPDRATEYRLRAVLEPVGAIITEWSRAADGTLTVRWRREDEEHTVRLRQAASPITSGICLPGMRGFDPSLLLHFLLQHALDSWRG